MPNIKTIQNMYLKIRHTVYLCRRMGCRELTYVILKPSIKTIVYDP